MLSLKKCSPCKHKDLVLILRIHIKSMNPYVTGLWVVSQFEEVEMGRPVGLASQSAWAT